MPEWLIERGIGETRAVRVERGEIVEARIFLDGIVRAGTVIEARLAKTDMPALAVGDGQEYLLPNGAPGASEGATIAIEITREPIPGTEPWKRPLARLATPDAAVSADHPDGEILPIPSPADRLAELGWCDLLEEARAAAVPFSGGELRVSPTPAMTLIDVDGQLSPFELALAGAAAAARTILRHGIGGSIGIDLPTVAGRTERQAIAAAIDAILPRPFERTAVNGFGFLQIVRPRRHASLFELAADRAAFEARALLRRASFERTGATRLVGHPAVIAVLEQRRDWLDALARQVGGAVTLRGDPSLPIHGAYAEAG